MIPLSKYVNKLVFSKTIHFNCRSLSSNSHTFNSVIIEDRGKVRLIGINRPDVRNAVNQSTAQELKQAFTDFDTDSEMKVAVLHGIGGSFCAGYDLSELSKSDQEGVEVDIGTIIKRGPMVS